MNIASRLNIVHLLLKGEQSFEADSSAEEYVIEFKNRNLISATVPVLQFNFINIELLSQYLRILAAKSNFIGFIITSPRVVDAIHMAFNLLDENDRLNVVGKISPDLLFIVGNKSASRCEAKLGKKCNNKSPESGNGHNLAEYIKQFCDNFLKTRNDVITLLYPKGNHSDTLMENRLEHVDGLDIKPLVVYETCTRSDISDTIVHAIDELKIKNEPLIVNLIFFSPSGVKGFVEINREQLIKQLQQVTSTNSVDFLYSSIGKTTEGALTNNKFPVFSVALKPSPASLADAIQQSVSERLDEG